MAKKDGVTVSDMMSDFKKKYGEWLFYEDMEVERIPSGIFPLDLALGGGFPRGRISLLYGPEDSGKSMITLLTLKMAQKLHPEQTHVFFDIERNFDSKWASKVGVDVDKLVVLRPNYAEQVSDMVLGVLEAEDCGVVVLDSLAAMVSHKVYDGDSSVIQVGGSSITINVMINKALVYLTEGNQKNPPTLICINQVRDKIGGMYANMEQLPGGRAIRFANTLSLRVYGKTKIMKDVHAMIPSKIEMACEVRKYKVPIFSTVSKFDMCVWPNSGLSYGEVDSWNTVVTYLKQSGLMKSADKGSGWELFGQSYKTQTEIRDKMRGDFNFDLKVKSEIIKYAYRIIEGVDEEGKPHVES